ncbi:hypothetical protein J4422_00265 [Candidatus Pacearchaeota archaeon]|nr:hypothetical protein [Candidatus Pacearchaeota archaeon]
MDLIDRLKAIAKAMEIPESDLTLKNIKPFLREHESHNSTKIIISYDNKGIRYIRLDCSPYTMGSTQTLHSTSIYERNYDKKVLPFHGRKNRNT